MWSAQTRKVKELTMKRGKRHNILKFWHSLDYCCKREYISRSNVIYNPSLELGEQKSNFQQSDLKFLDDFCNLIQENPERKNKKNWLTLENCTKNLLREVYTRKIGSTPEVGQGEQVVLQITPPLSRPGRCCAHKIQIFLHLEAYSFSPKWNIT